MSPVPTEPNSLTTGYAPVSSASHSAVTTAGPQARAAREQLVGADGEHGADLAGGQLVADRAGVAAQQPQAVVGCRVGRHGLVPVGADAGGTAVDPAGRGELAGGVPGRLDALHRLGAGDGPGRAVGEPDDVRDRQAAAVEDHDAGRGRESTIWDDIMRETPPYSGRSVLPREPSVTSDLPRGH